MICHEHTAIYIYLSPRDNSVIYLRFALNVLGGLSLRYSAVQQLCGVENVSHLTVRQNAVESDGYRFQKIYLFPIVVATPEGLARNFEGNDQYI